MLCLRLEGTRTTVTLWQSVCNLVGSNRDAALAKLCTAATIQVNPAARERQGSCPPVHCGAGDATPAPSACQAGLKQTPPAEAHRSYCCYKVNERKLPRSTGATSACCSVQESIRVCVCLNGFHDFQMFCLLLAHTHTHTRTHMHTGGP